MRAIFIGCVVLAAISLLLPSQPSFDPWAWVVWGREVALFSLDTSGGPSWKPLPVMFTTVFAPFGVIHDGIAPALWLVVARTGALLSLVLAFRLARRLAGPDKWTGIGAGLVAALALAFAPQWLRYAAHGNEVPMAIALMLWAVDRHLDGHQRQAFALGFLVCLLRPEAFPFVAVYGAWLCWAQPRQRLLVGAAALALPILWLVPEWIGSGDPFGAGRQASSEPPWSLSLRDHPWLAALGRWHRMVGLPLELGVAVAAVFAVVRRDRRTLALLAFTVGWIGLIVLMTQAGFSGSTRYFAPAVVGVCILAGLAAAWTVETARRASPAAGVWAAIAIAIAVTPWVGQRVDQLDRQGRASAKMVRLQNELVDALRSAGGPDQVVAAGAPSVNRGFMTRLAWETRLPMVQIERSRGDGLVFSTPGNAFWGRLPDLPGLTQPPSVLARVGHWQVLGHPAEIAGAPSLSSSPAAAGAVRRR